MVMAFTVTEFVTGWNAVETLGEGAFGEVKLLIQQETGEEVAMKIVDLAKHPDAVDAVRKEICLHRMLQHSNIIKFFGSRKEESMQYMFLEYAVGGELFDRIEPDLGMDVAQAQKYFRDLINGVEYLHEQGITHRDIKPENLLLDANDVLKITDFGMATLFRYNGKERELDRKCGTKPYMAPEVLLRPYSAKPADIWSCGVVLVALLAGELPWDEPTLSCPEFILWKDRDGSTLLSCSPWKKIDTLALSLLRKILNPAPRYRSTIPVIKSHSWILKDFLKSGAAQEVESGGRGRRNGKRICSVLDNSNPEMYLDDAATRVACSQPLPQLEVDVVDDSKYNLVPKVVPSFSQPANPDQLLLSTQLCQFTQTCHGNSTPFQRLVKRMTRLLVKTTLADTIVQLEAQFKKLNYIHKSSANVLTITTLDRRGAQLVFKASIFDMGVHTLIDFRLSKGCGLDFKRKFLKVKEGLENIIIRGPVTWSMALATNMLPA